MRGCHISVNSMYLFTLYHNLFIFVLVFCLCFVHLSFLLRRSHRCIMLMVFMRQGFSEGIGDRVDWTRLISVIGRKFVWLVIFGIFSGVSYYLWLLICLLPKKLLWWRKLVLCMGCLSYFFLKSFVSFVDWLCVLLFLFIISVG